MHESRREVFSSTKSTQDTNITQMRVNKDHALSHLTHTKKYVLKKFHLIIQVHPLHIIEPSNLHLKMILLSSTPCMIQL